MLVASGSAVCELVAAVASVGRISGRRSSRSAAGPAGWAATSRQMLGLECVVPDGAEVISSIGDALSLVRAERERTRPRADAAGHPAAHDEVEARWSPAGAAPGSIDIRIEEQPDKGTVRAVATGAIGLHAGAMPGRPAARRRGRGAASPRGGGDVRPCRLVLAGRPAEEVVVLDRFGEPAAEITVRSSSARRGAALVEKLTRYRGPVTVRPTVWVIDGAWLMEIASGDVVESAEALAADAPRLQTFIVGRS